MIRILRIRQFIVQIGHFMTDRIIRRIVCRPFHPAKIASREYRQLLVDGPCAVVSKIAVNAADQ